MKPGMLWTRWWIVGILTAMVLGTVAACGGEVEVTRIVEEQVEVTRIVEGESMVVEVTREVSMEVEVTVVVEPTATIPPDVGRQVDDNVVLVFDSEPVSMFFPKQQTAISDTPVRDNLVDPMVWQSNAPGDDYKLVPTTLTTGLGEYRCRHLAFLPQRGRQVPQW